MAIRNLDYYFDAQQKRFLSQLVRAFSGFQYQPGVRNGVQGALRTVPCRMASNNKMVGSIMRNQSENTLLTVPLITIWQTALTGRRDAVQYPGFVDSLQVSERAVVNGQYTGDEGQRYTVQRIMARPFEMTVQVDIWTSNLEQKHQLAEQILPVIYPSFDVQNSQNPIDWTALTTVYVENVTLSSRSIPIGADSEIDIMTIELRVPIWLSPPAKVTKQTLIQQIVTNILDGDEEDGAIVGTPMTTVITTPGDYHVLVEGDSIVLKNQDGGDLDANGDPLAWANVLPLYGKLRPATSMIRLFTTPDPEGTFVTGTLQVNSAHPNTLLWQIDPDTLPGNTLLPINAIIDPLRNLPGEALPAPVEGTRYLVIADIGPSHAWPNLVAHNNDIIQYHNGAWGVAFQATSQHTVQHVLNLHSGRQLRWSGSEWLMSIDGLYGPGYWRLVL